MTFYQELQLSSAGSKQLIKNTTDKKEKWRHILIYNFKVYLVMAFCVAVVTLYTKLTGQENSVAGVTVLLALLVLRQADFGIRTSHGLLSIVGIFTIMMAGPRLANMASPVGAFFINCVCILLLMIFGCHNVIMHNHSTFVLGYLLLYGYDVSGRAFALRVIGLTAGMLVETDTDRLKCNADRFAAWTSESNVGRDRMYVSLPSIYRGWKNEGGGQGRV